MKANNPTATLRATTSVSQRAWVRQAWIYALLLGGAVIFAWPLVWMFLTSVKTEREISSVTAGPLPEAPHRHAQSPYVDQNWFPLPATAAGRELLPAVEQVLRQMKPAWPEGLTQDEAVPAVARGIVKRL